MRDRLARLETAQGPLTPGAVIVTVTTNLLASGAIAFDPIVSDHQHAAAQLPLGLAEKVYLELIGDHDLEPDTHLLGNPHSAATGSYYIGPFGRPVIEGFFGRRRRGAVRARVDERCGCVCDRGMGRTDRPQSSTRST